jgi:hypothetical protein
MVGDGDTGVADNGVVFGFSSTLPLTSANCASSIGLIATSSSGKDVDADSSVKPVGRGEAVAKTISMSSLRVVGVRFIALLGSGLGTDRCAERSAEC